MTDVQDTRPEDLAGLHLGWIGPGDADAGTAAQMALGSPTGMTASDLQRLERIGFEIRLAGTPMTYRIAEDAWRSLKSMVATMSYVRTPEKKARRTEFFWTPEDQGRRFIAALANFLSAARMYVDSVPDVISQHQGRESPQYAGFREDLSDRFDNSPGYRFCYQLRNLLQHTGSLPLHLTVSAGVNGQPSVELLARRDELLAHRWHKLVRADITDWPDEVDVLPLFDASWETHWWIERRRARRAFEGVCTELTFVREWVDALNLNEDQTPALIRVERKETGSWKMAPSLLPTVDQVDAILRARDDGDILEFFESQGDKQQPNDLAERTLSPGMCHGYDLALSVLDLWHVSGPEQAREQTQRIVASGPDTSLLALMAFVELAGIPMLQVDAMLGNGVGEALVAHHRDVERSRAVHAQSASDNAPSQSSERG